MPNSYSPMNLLTHSFPKKAAFTLAEVLITLGIIGVVAALTLPALIQNYQRKVVESQLKETYSILLQAMQHSIKDDMPFYTVNNSSGGCQKWYEDYLGQYIKTKRICIVTAGCWAEEGTMLINGSEPGYFKKEKGIGNGHITVQIENGAFLNVDVYDSASSFGVSGTAMVIHADVNGDKKPNIIGKDVYIMVWTEKGLYPAGYNQTFETVKNNCLTGNGHYCLQYVMGNNWTIDPNVWNR